MPRRRASTGLRLFVAGLVVVLLAGIVGVGVLVVRVVGDLQAAGVDDAPVASGDRDRDPGSGPGDTGGSGDGGSTATAPPGDVALLAEQWQDGDDTFVFELEGLADSFRGPDHWGCARMDATATSSRWACTDEGGSFPPKPRNDPPTVGRIETHACPAPCAIADEASLEKYAGSFAPLVGRLRQLDDRTWWLDAPADDRGLTPMVMARNYDSDDDQQPDQVLFAFFSASEPDVEMAGKTMRDLYDRQR